jgi:putative inorganic carbon (hco3(-)) transporter
VSALSESPVSRRTGGWHVGASRTGELVGSRAIAQAGPQLFIFLIWTNALVVATQFHGVPQSVLALSYVLLLAPAAVAIFVRREPIILTHGTAFVLLYGAALAISAVFAGDVRATLPPIQTYLIEGLALFILLTNAVRTTSAVRRAAWTIVMATLLLGSLSLLQEVTGNHDSNYWGFSQSEADRIKVADTLAGKEMRPRLAGPIGSPNRYAQILVVALPLALMRIVGERRMKQKAVAVAATAAAVAGIALSFSRGAAVALVLVLLLGVAIRAIRLRFVAAIALAGFVVLLLAAPLYLSRLASLQEVQDLGSAEGAADGAIVGRATSNLAALAVFIDHPIVGVGPLQYADQYSRDTANDLGLRHFDTNRRGHNLYLETAADLGVVGLTAFLAIPAITCVQLWRLSTRLRHRRPDLSNLALSFVLAIAGYYAAGLFLHLSYQRYLWLLLALANAAVWTIQRETAAVELTNSSDAQPVSRRA